METNKFIILKDKLIYFSKGKAAKNCSKTLRLVISQDKENGETITLLTNKRTFSNFCSEIGVRLFIHEKLQSWFCFKYSEKSKPEKSTFLEFDFG